MEGKTIQLTVRCEITAWCYMAVLTENFLLAFFLAIISLNQYRDVKPRGQRIENKVFFHHQFCSNLARVFEATPERTVCRMLSCLWV